MSQVSRLGCAANHRTRTSQRPSVAASAVFLKPIGSETWGSYDEHVAERAKAGLPPLPLTSDQVGELIGYLEEAKEEDGGRLLHLLANRVPPGVDDAAELKASFLASIANESRPSRFLSLREAIRLLGTMVGGYNVDHLVGLLDLPDVAADAADALSRIVLIYEKFEDVAGRANSGNEFARQVIVRWAAMEWFHATPELAKEIDLVVFKVPGETNTDDLSPATDVSTRQDIPLHAMAMLKFARDGVVPDEPGVRGPVQHLTALKQSGDQIAYCGDLVGTGSSRMSATNNLMWHTGHDVTFVPDKRVGGVCLAGKFAPIFLNTLLDSGALPIEVCRFR